MEDTGAIAALVQQVLKGREAQGSQNKHGQLLFGCVYKQIEHYRRVNRMKRQISVLLLAFVVIIRRMEEVLLDKAEPLKAFALCQCFISVLAIVRRQVSQPKELTKICLWETTAQQHIKRQNLSNNFQIENFEQRYIKMMILPE